MKLKKNMIAMLGTLMILITLTSTIYATAASAWGSFNAYLLSVQTDNEVSTIAKASTTKYFSINISSISGGYTAVRAWTENALGKNFSSPYKTINKGASNISYTTQPSVGTNVVLNVDNPVNTSDIPKVSGKWTPN